MALSAPTKQRPLAGVRVVEIAGLGPVPFAAMLLCELGADVVRIEQPHAARKGIGVDPVTSPMHSGRTVLELDLKKPDDLDRLWRLLEAADVLIEGMRPGAAERLGLDENSCRTKNPALIYARLSGWERSSPEAATAGHDINYIAQAGLLGLMGPSNEPPSPPLILGADFPGGFLLALKIVAALHARTNGAEGCVVDQSLVGAAAMIGNTFGALMRSGNWSVQRGENLLDGGAPFYRTYLTKDGKYVAVGALEEPFYRALLNGLDLADKVPDRRDRAAWPSIERAFADAFASRTQHEWAERFAGSDACVTPVLDAAELAKKPVAMLSTPPVRSETEILQVWKHISCESRRGRTQSK